ncbi:piezo-type mechanosensitive ion channel component 1, partial [Nematolebias whitei]|uniref:piezo-type mechanosensitive ion channel component 1 n=1 Tax=Nematolebias whitei TaxID=451745 RepID=UPI00189A2341
MGPAAGKRSYLDMAKVLVFRYFFWFVLSVVFITGATRISVFGLGYLLASFFFLLLGTKLLVKSSRTRLILWDCLIIYTVAVIISKNVLSILACVFVFEMQKGFCWVIQLFSLVCTVKGYYDTNAVSSESCSLPVEEAGILWDSLCFLCLLLQRRVFLSFYFLHVTAELQAFAKQASSNVARPLSTQSCENDILEEEEEEELEEQESVHGEMVQKILDILRFLWAIILAMVDGLTQWLNLLTKQYSNTSTVLCNERYFSIHKIEPCNVAAGSRDDQASQISEMSTLDTFLDETDAESSVRNSSAQSRGATDLSSPRQNSNANLLTVESQLSCGLQPFKPHRHSRTASEILSDRHFFIEELEQSKEFFNNQNRLLKLLLSMYTVLSANSELVCYFIIVLNNVVSASVISLVLPMLVFLWAMLSVPRPTKRFWMTAIVYTEVMVVLKYIFQFGFFPWNSVYEMTLNKDKPFFPPRIFGLEKTDNYIRYDLLQLLVLFFHRSLLMQYGLWDHEGPLDEKSSSKERGKNVKEGNGRKKKEKEEVTGEGYTFSTSSTLEDLDKIEKNPFEQDDEDCLEPSTSSVATSVHPLEADPETAESKDGEELHSRRKNEDSVNKEEKDSDQVTKESPKRGSNIRIRKKNKKSKEKHNKVDPPAESADTSEELKKKKGKGRRTEAKLRLLAVGHKIKHVLTSGVQSVKRPAQGFFRNIIRSEYRASTDVYALMFLTDVIDFVIIIFGFWAFGKHSAAADIASTLSEDQVPEAFLVMLLIQFSTMIIDRALYLRKAVLGKLIFQMILVLGIHLWMFFILPGVTERMFNQNFVAQLWYFVKCIYFGLSAYQIRCGYPTRILGNFLTKKYNHLNLFLFQGFRLVPFLVELRAVMDWVWTDTTLSLSDWMCVEDIYANIFIIKCSRETEKKYPQPKGQKKKKIVKYGMGGLIIFFLICIIWFPLLFISLVRSVVGVVNHPIDVTVTVKLGGYEPLFTMSVQQQSIKPLTDAEFDQLTKDFGDNAVAMQFITLYSCEDIVTAMIEGSSGSVWRISPPSRQEVIKELLGSPVDLTLRLAWNF